MHKLMSMPAINEADTSSEEEEGDNERKTPKKRKGKKPKVKTGSGSMKTHPHFIEEKDEIEEEIPPVKPPPRKGIKHFFRGLCSCTKEKKYDRSGALLKVDENVWNLIFIFDRYVFYKSAGYVLLTHVYAI